MVDDVDKQVVFISTKVADRILDPVLRENLDAWTQKRLIETETKYGY